jgi:hypothetical protein
LNAGVAACCTVFVKFVMLLLYDKGLIHLFETDTGFSGF